MISGITIFTFLLSISSWAFLQSYVKPIKVEGSIYVPKVFDNGTDLIIVKANSDFPESAIKPTLEQVSRNLKVGSRSGVLVKIKLRKVDYVEEGISKPILLGEITKDFRINQSNSSNE